LGGGAIEGCHVH